MPLAGFQDEKYTDYDAFLDSRVYCKALDDFGITGILTLRPTLHYVH